MWLNRTARSHPSQSKSVFSLNNGAFRDTTPSSNSIACGDSTTAHNPWVHPPCIDWGSIGKTISIRNQTCFGQATTSPAASDQWGSNENGLVSVTAFETCIFGSLSFQTIRYLGFIGVHFGLDEWIRRSHQIASQSKVLFGYGRVGGISMGFVDQKLLLLDFAGLSVQMVPCALRLQSASVGSTTELEQCDYQQRTRKRFESIHLQKLRIHNLYCQVP